MKVQVILTACLAVLFMSLDTSAAISSKHAHQNKHRKKHAPKVIVLSNDDLPRYGHYVMVPPDPPKYAAVAPVYPPVPPYQPH